MPRESTPRATCISQWRVWLSLLIVMHNVSHFCVFFPSYLHWLACLYLLIPRVYTIFIVLKIGWFLFRVLRTITDNSLHPKESQLSWVVAVFGIRQSSKGDRLLLNQELTSGQCLQVSVSGKEDRLVTGAFNHSPKLHSA